MRRTTHRTQSGLLTWSALLATALSACAGPQDSSKSAADARQPKSRSGRPVDHSLIEQSAMREHALKILTDGAVAKEPLIRANSIEGLQAAPSRAEAPARAGLSDENPGVRFSAAMTVGILRLKDSAPFLEPLIDDRDPRVRCAAMYALTRLGKSVDLSPLARMLEDPDPRFRSEAARVLGELGNPSAMPMLRAAAAQSTRSSSSSGSEGRYQSERLFQLQVAEALATLGDEGAADSIRAALYPAAREGFESAALAAQILGNIKDTKAIGQLVDLIEQTVPGTPTFEDPRKNTFVQPPEIRLTAARSLAQMGYPGGMYVAQMYDNDPSPVVRSLTAFVFGEGVNPSDLRALEKLMADPSPIVRVAAAAATLHRLERGS